MTRRFAYEGTRFVDSLHGVAAASPRFRAIRAQAGREKLDAYRDRRAKFGLPVARSVADVDRALAAWEAAHPDDLELAEDDGHFFGYRNVAAGKLDRYSTSCSCRPSARRRPTPPISATLPSVRASSRRSVG